ncbi:filamentous hemagglutinin N-terminal domain-containing protein [Proteus myxofaciens]|nr:filamentous hemagglutinin N-terminal domain-containing protein [Proteus myxofaciens]
MSRENKFSFKVNLLVFSILSTLNMATVVHADPAANIGQNKNVEVINIAAAINGSSINEVKTFNVPKEGVILNNSINEIETILSGKVPGNNNLSNSVAEDIILEVKTKKASILNGPVEVAGTNARIILSNPSGITCSSCNFLSANRVVLTTGSLEIQDSAVNGYKVEKGNITINGNAVIDETTEQLDLIARNVLVDGVMDAAGVNVKMTTGANAVDKDNESITAIKGSGAASKYSLQVLKYGEIKDESFQFVGPEKKANLINNGTIESSESGIDISHTGALVNEKGSILSSGDINAVFENGITNKTGKIQSSKAISIDIKNEKLSNINGGNISGIGNVSINSGELNNEASYIASEDKVNINTNMKEMTNASTIGDEVGIAATNGITINSGTFNNKAGQMRSEDYIDINTNIKSFSNINSRIDAAGDITLNSGEIINDQSRLRSVKSLSIDTNGNSLKNTGLTADTASDDSLGILSGSGGMSINTAGLNNDQGIIATEGPLNLANKGDYSSKWGQIKTGGYLTFNSEKFFNQYGGLASQFGANITIEKTLDNTYGVLYLEGDDVVVNAPYINNNKGVIKGDVIHLKTDKFNNTAGFTVTEVKLEVDAPEVTNNNSAEFKTEMGFYLGQPDQKGGIVSKGNMILKGNKLSSTSGRIVTENGDMKLNYQNIDNTKGLIASKKEASVISTFFTNTQGTLFGENKLTLRTGVLKNNGSGSVDSNDLKGVVASEGISDITIYTDFENSGMISGIKKLMMNIEGKYTNAVDSVASGEESLELNVKGNIINRGILNSVKTSTISGQNITNEKSGVIVGKEKLTINNSGKYTNKGKVISPDEE